MVGFLPLAHFAPPPSPSLSPEEIAAVYQQNLSGIRFGAGITMIGAAFYGCFFGAISMVMKRMEGPRAPYTWVQTITGAVVTACFFLGALFLTLTAYRPDRPPEMTQLLNDLAWFTMVTPGIIGTVQTAAFGAAILGDKRPVPLMPRWSGYLCFMLALAFLPEDTAIFFYDGPFAWNGLFPFWVPIILLSVWMVSCTYLMLQARKRTD
ncbi:hypothetical protein NSU_3646 [Novosphingobium pentaromativorans US6-1]|uniref:Integral membrane protein n=2 Tax=Novosphingobium pentaromativorans TaxID=205844 RepID=G6EH25_9SPHN|nr:hypothetical protein NSU_3646 [Novosphingobium pentaromativorans US6-1]